ncbi:hypothetical protein PanWU01x14_200120 [Parasponia andersonii]|uniref:Uncharacterized protein n=1 Tax=Parasponia andersonii TaxID=3476 RepID=A0A2P5BYI4_PARAD|nr:hypothetical protein PanWU01x14_200120 [Parasponia andersonii]
MQNFRYGKKKKKRSIFKNKQILKFPQNQNFLTQKLTKPKRKNQILIKKISTCKLGSMEPEDEWVGNWSHDQSVKVQEKGEMASNNLAEMTSFEGEDSSKVWGT